MITPQEYVDRFNDKPPDTMWVHGLDLLQHCLQGDRTKTFWRDTKHHKKYLWEVQEELERHSNVEKENLNKVLEDGLRQQTKWKRVDDYSGDLDIDMYLGDRSGDSPMFNSYTKEKRFRPAMNILMDCEIPWGERGGSEMIRRHKRVYELTVQAVNEGRPCRVIAASRFQIDEMPRMTLFIVVKDFSEPIFSGIWGAFKTNASTNSFLNVIMDYWIGTSDFGNGSAVGFSASEYFTENEVTIVDAKRITP